MGGEGVRGVLEQRHAQLTGESAAVRDPVEVRVGAVDRPGPWAPPVATPATPAAVSACPPVDMGRRNTTGMRAPHLLVKELFTGHILTSCRSSWRGADTRRACHRRCRSVA